MAVSVGTMVKQIAGLLDTGDLSDWETRFVKSIDQSTQNGNRTQFLSEAKLDTVEKIYDKHFAG